MNLPKRWQLQPQEIPEVRAEDIGSVRNVLNGLGKRLQYSCEGDMPVVWYGDEGEIEFSFYPVTTSIISPFVLQSDTIRSDTKRRIAIIPGSRSKLLSYKLMKDPRLNEKVLVGWRIMKFRHLRRMMDRKGITRSLWEKLLDNDPVRWEDATQLEMFDD